MIYYYCSTMNNRLYTIAAVVMFSLLGTVAQGQSLQSEIDYDKLHQLISFCDSTKADEILIMYKGETVKHWKNPYCDTVYMHTRSMVKSWTALVVGILIDKEIIKSVDDLVCNYLPEWEDGCRHKVTIRNLLNMTAGFNRKSGQGALVQEDINTWLLKQKLDTLPNIRMAYSNESVQLLGIIIERVTDKDAEAVFKELLFDPLSMDSSWLARDDSGNSVVFGGCKTTVQDAAQIALLMRNKGKHMGRQIVSKSWIEESVSPSKICSYYGFLWWLDNVSANKNYAAMGDLGQMTIIFPKLDLILIRRQNCDLSPSSLNMSWMGPGFLQLIAEIVLI